MDLLAIGTLVLAAATVVLALVALSEVRRNRRHRPALSLSLGPNGGVDTAHTASGARVLFVRLAIRNERGKDAARDVQVVLTSVTGGAAFSESPLLPFNWTHANFATRLDVPSGTERFLDFVEQPHGDNTVWLCLLPRPFNEWWKLDPGTYTARLELSASNADATFYDVVFMAGSSPDVRSVTPTTA